MTLAERLMLGGIAVFVLYILGHIVLWTTL